MASPADLQLSVPGTPRALAADRRPVLWLALGMFCLYLLTSSLRGPRLGDSGEMFGAAQHMLAVLGGAELQPSALTKFGLGQPLLNLLVAWIAHAVADGELTQRIWGMLAINTLGAALGTGSVVLVLLTARRLGYAPRVSLGCALLAGLATMTWVYAQSLFADSTVGLCWQLSLWALLVYRDEGRRRWLVLAGWAAGYAVLCKVAALLALPVLLVYAGWRMQQRGHGWRAAGWLLAPLLVIGALLLGYNHLRYSAALQFGYDQGRDGQFGFNTPWLEGLLGLLVSPGKGLFIYNPILLLALGGFWSFARKWRAEAGLILGLSLTLLLVHARWWAWHGDWSWGPRFLAGLTPLLALLCAPPLHHWRSWRGPALALLLLSSAMVQGLGLLIYPGDYIRITALHTPITPQPFYDAQLWPVRDDGAYLRFNPWLSPLLGHAWLIRAALQPTPAEQQRVLAQPPWLSQYPQWGLTSFPQDPILLNLWWLKAWQSQMPGYRWMLLAASALALGAAAGLGRSMALSWRVAAGDGEVNATDTAAALPRG